MKGNNSFSHLTSSGAARMVNISQKETTRRMARAEAWVKVGEELVTKLKSDGGLVKGNVIETARIAGIMAAKRTSELIPMCHQIALDAVEIDAELSNDSVRIESRVHCDGKTGVEMEAMTAAAISALTVYDMVKSAGKGIQIGPVQLIEKTGGKSGHWKREE
ncbi:cyclic pyranopterin monophosphate synthase MoaC [Candidatus Latescibacterota bacterium]